MFATDLLHINSCGPIDPVGMLATEMLQRDLPELVLSLDITPTSHLIPALLCVMCLFECFVRL